MSAIVGAVYLDGRPFDHSLLETLVDHAAPWPADDQGTWSDSIVGFGHRMLHTTPESLREKLPFDDEAGYVITADARIDNRKELIHDLSLGYFDFEAIADSELILKAYKKWGEQCPKYLLGDFAFAIWDKSKHKLFCARDPMGIRPFYYYSSERLFIFASSLDALLQHTEVPKQLNEFRLACFLSLNFDDCINTFYRDIFRLNGSYSLVVENGRCRIQQYWEFDPEREIQMGSNTEYEEAMREVFFKSVRCRLRTDFPIGSHLSGGLDSSSVVCAARKILEERNGTPLHTFSAIFPASAEADSRIDERPYINAVAELENIIQHNVLADHGSPLFDILWTQPEPIIGINFYMDWLIEKAARRRNIRVLLTGHDGDTTISHGYDLFLELTKRLKWIKLSREIKALCRLWDQPIHKAIRNLCVRPLVPQFWKGAYRSFRGRTKPPLSHGGLKLNSEFIKRTGIDDHLNLVYKANLSAQSNSPRQNHLNAVISGLMYNATEMLRVLADHTSLEIACPFFDRRLIEFCLALPLSQKMQNGFNRSIMRRSMEGLLPTAIQSRVTKGHLTVGFTKSMHDQTDKLFENTIEKNIDLAAQYIDIGELKKSYFNFKNESLLVDTEAIRMSLAIVAVKWLEHTNIC